MEYLRRKRINSVFAMSVSIVVPNAVQSSLQNAPFLLKHKIFKSRRKSFEFQRNSQILNPATLPNRHQQIRFAL
ncbi:Zinc finger protein [Dirofilaria immitis]